TTPYMRPAERHEPRAGTLLRIRSLRIQARKKGNKPMKRRHRDAFTLIELMVVIAILVILAGMLFPVIASARDAACRCRCLANTHQLALAHHLYVGDNDDTLPSWQIRGPGGVAVLWTEFLRPYYRDTRLLDQGLTSPKQKDAMGWAADYALCTWGPGGEGTADKPYWRWPGCPWSSQEGGRPMRLAEVLRPAEALQIADGFTLRANAVMTSSMIRRRHMNGLLVGAFV